MHGGTMNLQQQLKEAKQKVIDIENEINKPKMGFDFVEWCQDTDNEYWLTKQTLVSSEFWDSSEESDGIRLNNHHLAEKIITWQIEKYIWSQRTSFMWAITSRNCFSTRRKDMSLWLMKVRRTVCSSGLAGMRFPIS